ncbi:hypothetical protein GCM10010420_53650 [Streptomyces glaucosporus]|uniref:Pvc16 N-terminal domain-containing protein n=1 Tax=Streptomyces glaucosporus TaxID=284044 RepID=A0ABN3IYT6_9ACTN
MSNALAIATVTQALARLIEHNLRPEIDMQVAVKTERPPAETPDGPTITVFLYQVTANTSQRNGDLPTRAADGTLLRRSAAALDLHYLISAYGNETELVGQRLIGCVVRTLHEIPVLPRPLIEEVARLPYLEGSDLAETVQKVRFTPTQMDIDETSKLWGMLHQTPYSLSVAYQASLVLIEGREQPVPARPVERRTVRAVPFGAPGAPERPKPLGTAGGAAGAPAARASATDAPPARPEKEEGGRAAPGTAAEKKPAAPAGKRRAATRTAPARSRTRRTSGTSARGGGATGGAAGGTGGENTGGPADGERD